MWQKKQIRHSIYHSNNQKQSTLIIESKSRNFIIIKIGKTSSIKSKKSCWCTKDKSEINPIISSKWIIKCKARKSACKIEHDERNKGDINKEWRDHKKNKRFHCIEKQVKSLICKERQIKLQTHINVVKDKIVIFLFNIDRMK